MRLGRDGLAEQFLLGRGFFLRAGFADEEAPHECVDERVLVGCVALASPAAPTDQIAAIFHADSSFCRRNARVPRIAFVP
jgi:hypothetical protein